MTKIITCGELRYHTLAELEALFRTLQSSGAPRPVRASALLCSPASKASAARWRHASPGSRSRERGRFKSAPEAAGHARGFQRVSGRTTLQSGLEHDVFKFLAAREAVEIGGHHAPAPVGGRVAGARTMRRDQHIGEFMERSRDGLRSGSTGWDIATRHRARSNSPPISAFAAS